MLNRNIYSLLDFKKFLHHYSIFHHHLDLVCSDEHVTFLLIIQDVQICVQSQDHVLNEMYDTKTAGSSRPPPPTPDPIKDIER